MTRLWPAARGQRFDAVQRHHLAANFSEAADAPMDPEEAFLVYSGNVAGVVPAGLAFGRGWRRLAAFRQQVSGHYVGAAQQQPAAVGKAGHGRQPMLQARE